MKSTGIVRRIDDLGRIVIPKEVRRTLDIAVGDPIEIYLEGDRIILRKYENDVDSPRALIREVLSTNDVANVIAPDLLERMKFEAEKAV